MDAMESLFDRAAVLFAWEQVAWLMQHLSKHAITPWAVMPLAARSRLSGDQTQACRHVCEEYAGARQLLLRRVGAGQRQC